MNLAVSFVTFCNKRNARLAALQVKNKKQLRTTGLYRSTRPPCLGQSSLAPKRGAPRARGCHQLSNAAGQASSCASSHTVPRGQTQPGQDCHTERNRSLEGAGRWHTPQTRCGCYSSILWQRHCCWVACLNADPQFTGVTLRLDSRKMPA